MASQSSNRYATASKENVTPPTPNFDSDKSQRQERTPEPKWELERDLALHMPTDVRLDDKREAEEAAKHTSGAQRKKKPARDDSLLSVLCAYILEHQIGLSINLLILLTLTHLLFPRARPLTRKFYELSYYDPATGKYNPGLDDLPFVSFWVIVLTGLRAALMDYVMVPAARAGGINKRKTRVRFAEQAWVGLYPAVSWTWGMYLMYQTPYWFNTREMWTHFPTQQMTGLFKYYYLVQLAFWLHMIVVVNIEERRKDYAQMFTHHLITCALIITSYGFYQTKAGHVILCIMDSVDILLPLAKCLKYLRYSTACDIAFGVFLVTWIIARHVCFLLVCWSIYAVIPEVMHVGCYQASSGAKLTSDPSAYSFGNSIIVNAFRGWTDPGGVVCNTRQITLAFLWLLMVLQGILLVWLGMIIRVAWGVITGKGADDSRSDEEDAEASEDEDVEADVRPQPTTAISGFAMRRSPSATGSSGSQSTPYEEEVGADKLYFGKRRTPSPRVKRKRSGAKGVTSAISIPGHSDPKDILNRIGCETKTTDKDEKER